MSVALMLLNEAGEMELWVGCWMVAYLWIIFIVLTSSVKS